MSNAWDTRVGGVLADSVTCNAVVKSFAGEAREDKIVDRVIGKWRKRTWRTWSRFNITGNQRGYRIPAISPFCKVEGGNFCPIV